MKPLRHLLFALVLLLAQSVALTHAVEHLRVDADTPTHTCALCIAAQGLDAALTGEAPDLVGGTAEFAPPTGVVIPVFSPSAVSPRARAPPAVL